MTQPYEFCSIFCSNLHTSLWPLAAQSVLKSSSTLKSSKIGLKCLQTLLFIYALLKSAIQIKKCSLNFYYRLYHITYMSKFDGELIETQFFWILQENGINSWNKPVSGMSFKKFKHKFIWETSAAIYFFRKRNFRIFNFDLGMEKIIFY